MDANYLQTQARLIRESYLLVLLFVFCALGMMLTINVIFYYVYINLYNIFHNEYIDIVPDNIWNVMLILNISLLAFMVISYLIRRALILKGGAAIAKYCGASEVTGENKDYFAKRYRDIVEELAVAASTPVPGIFLLDKVNNINAFAAGCSPDGAAIIVTQGAMEMLNRDELQAVIAHEFSHITHHDMWLNMQLIAFQSCINSIAESMSLFEDFANNPSRVLFAPLLPFIIIFMPLGIVGALFSYLLMLGVSRKRELLADASAVRYTRYNMGLVGALKKINCIPKLDYGSDGKLQFVSHMMFNPNTTLMGLVSSHPPILERIQAVDPAFTQTQINMLQKMYQSSMPNGKEEDRKLGYCVDDDNYIRTAAHDSKKMDDKELSDYILQLKLIHASSKPNYLGNILLLLIMISVVLALRGFGLKLYHEFNAVPAPPPGVVVNETPRIGKVYNVSEFNVKGYTLTPVNTYAIKARVLEMKAYKADAFSAISPVVFLLGWNMASDSARLKYIHITMHDFSFSFRYSAKAGLDGPAFIDNSVLVMIIPSTNSIAETIKKVQKNNIVNMSGYLVDVTSPSGAVKRTVLGDVNVHPQLIFYVQEITVK